MTNQFPSATKMVLSPAAQAVLRADAAARCLSEWDSVNDPPCHPSDGDWNGCIRCVNRSAVAAALRAAADQCKIEWNYHPDYPETESVIIVSDLFAIATELDLAP